jgi:uncharacterized protein (DUF2237 family)
MTVIKRRPILNTDKERRISFYRDGCCDTGREDVGSHTICVVMTSAFLEFSKSRGNDLSTAVPEFGFPGLKPGDRWCLAGRKHSRQAKRRESSCAPLTRVLSLTARLLILTLRNGPCVIAVPPTLAVLVTRLLPACRVRQLLSMVPSSARANETGLGKRVGSTETRCRKAPKLPRRDTSNRGRRSC